MTSSTLLHSIYCTTLDDSAWCAVATLAEPTYLNHKPKREAQRLGVRHLLQILLDTLSMPDTLDESQFPYRLMASQYYVSFSHSNNKVAVAIGRSRAVGIDIEVNPVSWRVAKRFFHHNEIALFDSMGDSERDTLLTLSWQLKESFIKIHQYTLAQGLGINYDFLIAKIRADINHNHPQIRIARDPSSDYHVTVLTQHQTVIVY